MRYGDFLECLKYETLSLYLGINRIYLINIIRLQIKKNCILTRMFSNILIEIGVDVRYFDTRPIYDVNESRSPTECFRVNITHNPIYLKMEI